MKNTLHHEITSLDSRVSERFDQQETRINTRFDEQETKVNARLDEQEVRMNTRFDDNDTILNEVLNVVGEIQEAQGKAIRLHADYIDNHERRITKLGKRTA